MFLDYFHFLAKLSLSILSEVRSGREDDKAGET